LDKLVDTCAPTPHGRKNKTWYDESYRLAKKMILSNYGLSQEIDQKEIFEAIGAITSQERIDNLLIKLNAYVQGGFFKVHRDSPKSEQHLGTLIIGLLSAFASGSLSISYKKQEHINWSDIAPLGASSFLM
ncbi:hypothetical protein M422DRAFT_193295, partial [Sphaerobolus stellatus SS14]